MAYARRRVYKPARRGIRDKKKLLMISAFAGGLILLVLLYLLLFTKVFAPAPLYNELSVPLPAAVAPTNTCVYYLKGTTLYCDDYNGGEIWQTKFSAGQQQLAASSSMICLYNEASATVIDAQRQVLFSVPGEDYKIIDIACGKTSLVMLCKQTAEDGTTSEFIRAFDMTGAEINRLDLEKAEVLQMGFSGDSDNLWYLTIDTTGVYPITQITTYALEQNKLTGLYKIYDQLSDRVYFLGTDMYVSGTTYLTSYDMFGEKLSSKLVYGYECVASYQNENDIIFAYAPSGSASGTSATVRVISKSGLDTLIQLPSGVKFFGLSGNQIYCFGGERAYIYELTGKFVSMTDLGFEVTTLRQLNGSTVLVGGADAQYLMTLK